MKSRAFVQRAVLSVDEKLASVSRWLHREQGTILSFLIHSLFASEEEAQCGLLDPQQGFTVAMLREFLAYFMREGFRFLSPRDLAEDLSPGGKYILLTFDDGYFNNTRALPLLEEFNVPAAFFISSGHVKQGKAFWWDALYRESGKRGRFAEEVRHKAAIYKQMAPLQIEADICSRFGRLALSPVGDLDRPFTPSELAKFASHPLVFLGNHTRDHAILTNCFSEEIRSQILDCQESLCEMTGKSPEIIAYPNGNCSREIGEAASGAGLLFGLLARPGRNLLPLQGGTSRAMTMKRFTLWGDRPVEAQCRASRSPLSLYRVLQGMAWKPKPSQPNLVSIRKEKPLARSASS
ncbi:MAG TPA: polysaccharide deacetylase family protein [Candidatus Acidoferrum sp.]|nr:polysaccharide deacetylase family protein [Candidatus Acidoferrum sp.]